MDVIFMKIGWNIYIYIFLGMNWTYGIFSSPAMVQKLFCKQNRSFFFIKLVAKVISSTNDQWQQKFFSLSRLVQKCFNNEDFFKFFFVENDEL